MLHYFFDDINQVTTDLRTNAKEGLSDFEIQARLKKYGQNVIERGKKTPLPLKYLKQFTDLLAIILLVASGLSFLLGSYKDAFIIFIVVVINATVGFVQEYKAERAIEALKKHLPQTTTVIREGDKVNISITQLVPGDVILLSEGIKVPADIRLASANELATNDATLTGEAEPQFKKALKNEGSRTSLVDICGSVFAGTEVVSGNGIGVVVATGMQTKLGTIAKVTIDQKQSKSPLQIETDHIAKTVAKATLFVVALLMGIYSILAGKFIIREAFEFAIGVSASLVPEGLPTTVTVALAVGIQKMARRKAAIRRLSAVETLGEANVIVTDKTGTLTKNEMTVKEIFYNDKNYHVKGVGYNLFGEFSSEGKILEKKDLSALKNLFLPAVYANNAEVDAKNHEKVEYFGDSTELALLVAAEKVGLDTFDMKEDAVVTDEIPFTSERKFMGKTIKSGARLSPLQTSYASGVRASFTPEVEQRRKSGEMVYIKGAPNIVLTKCTHILKSGKAVKLTEQDKKELNHANDNYCSEALRVIAVAQKIKDSKAADQNLTFVGLFGIIDPPREDVAETIQIAKRAGIRTIMVTGDYGLTAASIAKRIGLAENPEIITGEMLEDMNDGALIETLKKEEVLFSRVDPLHKLRIVKALQKMGNIVAVTGDGVNDAPALKKSDIGVAMGLSGTDVSKEAAEMVSLNDSFSSVVWAIREGRIVYENIKKVTKYVFTSNIAEFTAVALGLALGAPPILAVQILLVDLGAEVFPAIALAQDYAMEDVMSKPPRDRKDILFGKEVIFYTLRSGLVMGILATAAFVIYLMRHGWSFGTSPANYAVYPIATTVTYATIGLCQVVNSFSVRSAHEPVFKLMRHAKKLYLAICVTFVFVGSMIYIPILQDFSYNKAIGLSEWLLVIAFAGIYLLYLEVIKKLDHEPKKITRLVTEKIIKAES